MGFPARTIRLMAAGALRVCRGSPPSASGWAAQQRPQRGGVITPPHIPETDRQTRTRTRTRTPPPRPFLSAPARDARTRGLWPPPRGKGAAGAAAARARGELVPCGAHAGTAGLPRSSRLLPRWSGSGPRPWSSVPRRLRAGQEAPSETPGRPPRPPARTARHQWPRPPFEPRRGVGGAGAGPHPPPPPPLRAVGGLGDPEDTGSPREVRTSGEAPSRGLQVASRGLGSRGEEFGGHVELGRALPDLSQISLQISAAASAV